MQTQHLDDIGARHDDAGGAMLGTLAAGDFAAMDDALAPDVRLRALLPGGCHEWSGAGAVVHRFERWFGDTEAYELVGGEACPVGALVHLWWRIRLRAARFGEGWRTVQQQCYAELDAAGRIARLDLLCTGYLADGDA